MQIQMLLHGGMLMTEGSFEKICLKNTSAQLTEFIPKTKPILSLRVVEKEACCQLFTLERRPVSSVGRVPHYRVGGFKPRSDHHSGSLNN